MICDFGDLAAMPFLLSTAPQQNADRPLILSQREFQHPPGHSICAMITTAARSKWPDDVAIEDLNPAPVLVVRALSD